jgi:hypothetical protein
MKKIQKSTLKSSLKHAHKTKKRKPMKLIQNIENKNMMPKVNVLKKKLCFDK